MTHRGESRFWNGLLKNQQRVSPMCVQPMYKQNRSAPVLYKRNRPHGVPAADSRAGNTALRRRGKGGPKDCGPASSQNALRPASDLTAFDCALVVGLVPDGHDQHVQEQADPDVEQPAGVGAPVRAVGLYAAVEGLRVELGEARGDVPHVHHGEAELVQQLAGGVVPPVVLLHVEVVPVLAPELPAGPKRDVEVLRVALAHGGPHAARLPGEVLRARRAPNKHRHGLPVGPHVLQDGLEC
mmetsp:Transcript_11002/g.26095  ORF Transcript_11002/g.26095 Transcript_11002/m.26095 type:complete len:240 (-) Transcript_11002:1063-1782(-)